ncbi:MAG TPA: hypothetical protein VNL14_09750 [Candidatus Acidoferrales bacterium]|nr:hypothetical protein [Candidatus Acidoferrales bacterium]
MPKRWQPPDFVSREQCLKDSDSVLARAELPVRQTEDVFRIGALAMEWDIGVMVYEPEDPARIPVAPDGRKAGIFLLHGGSGDFRQMERVALLLARKFGYRVVSGTFPGRLYLPDPSRDWPGDTINPDGTVRTPIWKLGETIAPEEYELIQDRSMRNRYGTRTLARAKRETNFYYRMAAWPVAFEEGMKEACRRHFPQDQFSIYGQGHSTGGPFICMLSQRIANMAGVLATENSPFGYLCAARALWGGKIEGYDAVSEDRQLADPFTDLYIRTWRDHARYAGPEALGQEGPAALMRLPALMEDVFESWERSRRRPQFKAEYMVTHNITQSLTAAAKASAERLELDAEQTDALIKLYLSYTRELSVEEGKPVPPFLFGIAKDSPDHSADVYREVILPGFQAMKPAPKVSLVRFGAGVHQFWTPEPGLPMGIAPAVVRTWHEAIVEGYFAA